MKILSLHIISFGGLCNRDIDLAGGVNVIDGVNESGKSSAAMFIKFIFYGLSSKVLKSAGCSERQKYVNRQTNQAAGFIIAESSGGTPYRIERALVVSDGSTPREKIRIINQETGESVSGKNPGEYFFGVPEEVYISTCFVSQSSAVKPGVADAGTSSGTKSAVENLLTSADENIDISRAVKKLDAMRRELSHKIGNGGEIAQLKAKRDALAAQEDESVERTKELLAVSNSLSDIKKHIESLEESKEKYDRIFSCLEKINTVRKIDATRQAQTRIDKLNTALSEFDASGMGKEFSETLSAAERDVIAYDEECIAYNKRLPELESEEKAVPITNEAIDDAHVLESTMRTQLSVGIAMAVGCFVAVAAAVLLFFFNTGLHMLPLIVSAILITLSVAFLITRAGNKKKLSALLEEWEAESVNDMERAVRDKLNRDMNGMSLTEEHQRLNASIEASKLRFNVASDTVSRLAKSAGVSECDDIYDTIAALKAVIVKAGETREQMVSKIHNLSGRLEMMKEQLGSINPDEAEAAARSAAATKDGKLAASLDEAGIKKLIHERQFTDNAFRAAMKRSSLLEEKLAEIQKPMYAPDEIETMIATLDMKIEQLTARRDAIELAGQALLDAGESMRRGIIPRIGASASRIIASSTGKYDRMTIDGSFNCGLANENDIVTSEYLSRGTSDLTYIALRIALADEVFKGERPTVIFDESFAHIDKDRIKNVIRLLSVGQSDYQYIVFTCRADETDSARLLGCNTINL